MNPTIFNRKQQKELRQKLRNETSMPERLLWLHLRGKGCGGFKFRRQHGIGPYVVDFYCPEKHVVVEIDGDSHGTLEVVGRDLTRDKVLGELGITVLRFTNADICENVDAVVLRILSVLKPSNPS